MQKTKDIKVKLSSDLELIKITLESNKQQQTKLSTEFLELQQKQKESITLEPFKIEYEQLIIKLKEQQQRSSLL